MESTVVLESNVDPDRGLGLQVGPQLGYPGPHSPRAQPSQAHRAVRSVPIPGAGGSALCPYEAGSAPPGRASWVPGCGSKKRTRQALRRDVPLDPGLLTVQRGHTAGGRPKCPWEPGSGLRAAPQGTLTFSKTAFSAPSPCHPPHHRLPSYPSQGSQFPDCIHISRPPFIAFPASPAAPLPQALPPRATVPQLPAFAQVTEWHSNTHDTGLVKRTGSSGTSWPYELHFCVTVSVGAQMERILVRKQ